MSPIPPDYVDVAERIREFKAQYPDGSLQAIKEPKVISVGGKDFIVYAAAAFRSPDDKCPGVGYAWEPVPGPTPFTRDSELMNAETSAWGRAIVALGFSTKKIASADEVRNRQAAEEIPHEAPQAAPPLPEANPATKEQHEHLEAVLLQLSADFPKGEGEKTWQQQAGIFCKEQFGKRTRSELSVDEMNELAEQLQVMLDTLRLPSSSGQEAA